MRNYIQKGNTITCKAPINGVKSGDVVKVEDMIGVSITDANEGDIVLNLAGAYELSKAQVEIKQGQKVYWSESKKQITSTATGNNLLGIAMNNAAKETPSIIVRLNGSF